MGKDNRLEAAYDIFRNLYDECEKVKDFMDRYKAGI
jgi:hypothetical protein